MTWGGGRGTVVLISVQLLEMELVPFRKKKEKRWGKKKRKGGKKPLFLWEADKGCVFSLFED